MKLIKKRDLTATESASVKNGVLGSTVDRRAFLRRAGLGLGGTAVAATLPTAMIRRAEAARVERRRVQRLADTMTIGQAVVAGVAGNVVGDEDPVADAEFIDIDSDRINVYRVVVEDPDGQRHEERLPLTAYLEIVAATNFKQRIRKTLEYFHADRLNYAVVGTPNRVEYDQGFFVKVGDGAADAKPIAHLYKTQVYQLLILCRHFIHTIT